MYFQLEFLRIVASYLYPLVPGFHTVNRRFGKVTYVTVAIENGELIRLLHRRFEILEKIRVEARGQEEEDLAKNPTAVMTRTEGRWRAPWWKVEKRLYRPCSVVPWEIVL